MGCVLGFSHSSLAPLRRGISLTPQRSAPLATKSTSRALHSGQRSRLAHVRTVVAAPCCSTSPAVSGSNRCKHLFAPHDQPDLCGEGLAEGQQRHQRRLPRRFASIWLGSPIRLGAGYGSGGGAGGSRLSRIARSAFVRGRQRPARLFDLGSQQSHELSVCVFGKVRQEHQLDIANGRGQGESATTTCRQLMRTAVGPESPR
jgi:hypothetical protein